MTDPWKAESLTIVYAQEPLPAKVRKSIFLAGPTPRDEATPSWRPDAIQQLRDLGYDGHVLVPEDRETWNNDYLNQVEWETSALNMADVIVFWVPRNMKNMPALTTNIEWGVWGASGKVVFGAPDTAESVRYMKWQCDKLKVPSFTTLRETLGHAVKTIGEGAPRAGGEAKVPLHVWNNETFSGWYKAQRRAHNRLEDARVLWTYFTGEKRDTLFAWAVQVDIFVAEENRNKKIEFVLGRQDIASVVLFYKSEEETYIIMVREFRSPARTSDGFIVELPGGGVEGSTLETALKELKEETGFALEEGRLSLVGKKQLAGTFSAHFCSVYAAELTKQEFHQFFDRVGEVNGEDMNGGDDEERAYLTINPLSDLIHGTSNDVDWATLGMITTAIGKK
jgi:8-oxo-dGTP pyrophosphatase MutT (NUDIX family)